MLIAHTDYAAYHAEKASNEHVDECAPVQAPLTHLRQALPKPK